EEIDANSDGFLSLAEAQVAIPGFSLSAFAAIDKNNDGLLSEAEIQASALPAEGEGEGEGCALIAKSTRSDLGNKIGDFFLLGIALVTLGAWSLLGRRAS